MPIYLKFHRVEIPESGGWTKLLREIEPQSIAFPIAAIALGIKEISLCETCYVCAMKTPETGYLGR